MNTWRAVRFAFVVMAFVGWFAFMLIPVLFDLHDLQRFHPLENLPYMLIGLSLCGCIESAHKADANIQFFVFMTGLILLTGWF